MRGHEVVQAVLTRSAALRSGEEGGPGGQNRAAIACFVPFIGHLQCEMPYYVILLLREELLLLGLMAGKRSASKTPRPDILRSPRTVV